MSKYAKLEAMGTLGGRRMRQVFNETFSSEISAGGFSGQKINGFPYQVVDTGSYMSATGGKLSVSGGAGYLGSPYLQPIWGLTRLAKTELEFEITHNSAAVVNIGFTDVWNNNSAGHELYWAANGLVYIRVAGVNKASVAYSTGVSYRYKIILKDTGAYYYRSVAGGAWTLLYEDSTLTKKNLGVAYVGNAQSFTSDYFKLTAPRPIRRVSIIGDSLTSVSGNKNWNYHMIGNWTKGFYGWINHAIAGKKIMDTTGGMDDQVASCSTDNSNLILMCLGVNDLNAGDMNALKAKIASGVTTLRSTNPSATIIYVNLPKVWTDVGGGTEKDKSNIRTAISEQCVASGIPEVTLYDCPDYTSADTSDGVHPILAGAVKLEAHVRPQIEAYL